MKNRGCGKAAIFKKNDIAKIRKSFNAQHRLIFEIALFTGERMGAIAQLKVLDVYADPARSVPHEQITFAARTRKARPDGSRETRQIAIHPELAEYLKIYRPSATYYLFPGRAKNSETVDNTHITRRAIDKYWREQFSMTDGNTSANKVNCLDMKKVDKLVTWSNQNDTYNSFMLL